MGTDGGVDESVVQPAADEGEVQQRVGPLISGRFFFGGTKRRRGVGWWWCFTPIFANGVGIQAREADLQAPPPLRPSLSAGIAPLRPP
jgi:hypothetical protein